MAENHQDDANTHVLVNMASEVVSAYVSNNKIQPDELPALIRTVFDSFVSVSQQKNSQTQQKPAVPIVKSFTDDYIVCLEDGAKLKMLKRYLRTHYNMSPDDYRLKWGLPPTYPMVAPSYAAKRSAFAKRNGLGKAKS